MPLYETVFIIHPDHASRAKEWVDKFKRVVEEAQGTISKVEEWGLREMTYRIQKQKRGYYVLLYHVSSPSGMEELERQLKLSEGIIRYMTVRADESALPKTPTAGEKAPEGEDKEQKDDEKKASPAP